ncbi:MAG: Mur ligase family protein, partial [Cyanobacteria bacterium P01_F01_bin.153]
MVDRIRLGLAIWVARVVTALVRSLGMGAASVLPGSVARRIQPKALRLLARQYGQGVVLVAGTNGKTTTSLLLRSMFEDHGFSVTHNATGANLVNGLTAALLADANWWGRIDRDVAILEVDENVLRLVLPEIRPRVLLALNLFRDQLDRYGEVDTIARRWREAIAPLENATVVLNADDPALSEF